MLLIKENFRVSTLKFFLSKNKYKKEKQNEQTIGLQGIYKGEFTRTL